MQTTRFFNNERFYIQGFFKIKEDAQRKAEKYRKQGMKDRVVESKKRWRGRSWSYWYVWTDKRN